MKRSIQLFFTSLNGKFHLLPHGNICTIALINIHYYTNIDCSWEEWWKIIVPEVKFNLSLLFTEARKAEVNSRSRLNFTEGTIILYHSPNKREVNICFIPLIHRFFSPYRTVKSGKQAIEFQIRQLWQLLWDSEK